MRNKGVVVFLTIIITALCIYYLNFTFVSRDIQDDATGLATDTTGLVDFSKKQQYLDSVWNEPVYNLLGGSYTFKEVKDTELQLGLDLQGGMHVILEVSPVEILKGLSGDSQDPNFLEAIRTARQAQRTSQENYTDLFYQSWTELNPDRPLNEIFANAANRGRIDFNSTDTEVMQVINTEVEDAIGRTFNILRTRIDRFGTSQPNIQRLQGTGRIQVEIPGADNPERVRNLLQGVAKLEFWEVAKGEEYVQWFQAINDKLVQEQRSRLATLSTTEQESSDEEGTEDVDPLEGQIDLSELTASDRDTTGLLALDTTGAVEDTTASQLNADSLLQLSVSPLISLITDRTLPGFFYDIKDTSQINRIFKRDDVQAMIPRGFKIAWDIEPPGYEGYPENGLELHILKVARGGKAALTGDVITNAYQTLDPSNSSPAVSLQMNASGARIWKNLTTKAAGSNPKDRIAITLDNYVLTAPTVQNPIPNGQSIITGNFSLEDAQDLSNLLKAGSLPAPARIVQEDIIGPTLGQEAQRQGVVSIISGLVIVVLFMVAYYSKGGFVANFALLFNIFFIMGILAQLNAALTLPGMAGIVLTIGMSIDANVLIFERIREELRNGVKLREAISMGYRKAFSSIIDSNVTTFLTAMILYVMGQGPVKGFAITLMIGIVCSFFSAVFITHVIVDWLTRKGDESKLQFKTFISKGALSNIGIDFLGRRKRAYITSGAFITIGLVLIFMNGLNLGVDFKGGRSYVVTFSDSYFASDMKSALIDDFEGTGTEVKTFGSNNIFKVTTSYLVDDESREADETVKATLIGGLEEFTGHKFIEDDSKVTDGLFSISSSSKVGATIADDIQKSSQRSIMFSLIVIFIYILIRFRKWQFGLGAIVALFHDTLVVLSAFAIAGALGFNYEVDQVFIAAMLTIIGYSINDTVIVFDRIRENLGLKTSTDTIKTFNASINSTLNRTLITSMTTLIVVLVLLIFGGEVLQGFSFALLVGVLVGTYSSVFIASPVVVDLQKKQLATQTESK